MEIKATVKTTIQPKSETRKVVAEAIQDLDRKQLAKKAKQLFSTVNKRINRLEQSDAISPALQGLKKRRTPKFTIGGKDLKALRKEYADALAFYNKETSTISGSRNYTRLLENTFGERVHDKDFLNKMFRLLKDLENRLPDIYKNIYGKEVQEIIEQDASLQSRLMSEDAIEYYNAMTELVDKMIEQSTDEIHQQLQDLIDSISDSLGGGNLF